MRKATRVLQSFFARDEDGQIKGHCCIHKGLGLKNGRSLQVRLCKFS